MIHLFPSQKKSKKLLDGTWNVAWQTKKTLKRMEAVLACCLVAYMLHDCCFTIIPDFVYLAWNYEKVEKERQIREIRIRKELDKLKQEYKIQK
jgi:hypothetical protein